MRQIVLPYWTHPYDSTFHRHLDDSNGSLPQDPRLAQFYWIPWDSAGKMWFSEWKDYPPFADAPQQGTCAVPPYLTHSGLHGVHRVGGNTGGSSRFSDIIRLKWDQNNSFRTNNNCGRDDICCVY